MFMKKLRAMKIDAANWYVGARTIDASRPADNPCVMRTLLEVPKLFVNLGTIGTTISDVISATAIHGPREVSLVPYTLLNQRESNWILIPDANPTKPKVAENLVI
jgi:hypothetical protein